MLFVTVSYLLSRQGNWIVRLREIGVATELGSGKLGGAKQVEFSTVSAGEACSYSKQNQLGGQFILS